MKNKTTVSYPYVLYSQLGYCAIISCLQQGHYRFYVTSPKDYPEFDWFAPDHPDILKRVIKEKLDEVKYDLLKSFLIVTTTKRDEVESNPPS
jgi:hypothetical protein